MPIQTIKEIDLAKLKLEARFIPYLKRIFKHLAHDAKILYLSTKSVPATTLSLHYRPEFLKVIRDAQRASIKEFGFNLRKIGEGKGYHFKTDKYQALIDYQIKTKDIDPSLSDDDEEEINNNFAKASTYFVAEQSDQQADYVTKTNEKQISDAQKAAIILFFSTEAKLNSTLNELNNKLRAVEFEEMGGGSSSISKVKKQKLNEKIASTEKQLTNLKNNKSNFIADQIESNIISQSQSRSELIASQNVGLAESWSRNEEATLVDKALPDVTIKKKWEGILDNKIRPTHAEADGQIIAMNQDFIVGRYKAKYPRDPDLPMIESANCRCVALHSWK